MKKALTQKIEIPEGIEVNFNGNEVVVRGKEGENKRNLNFGKLEVDKKEGEIIISYEKATKREKKMMNTIAVHIKNMVKGAQERFEYKLRICSSHFPMSVNVEGDEVVIKNFLGEKISRKAKIPKGAEVKVQGKEIIVNSTDKEIAGQAAANIEQSTRIKSKDKRIFQDGIYIVGKAGREI